MLRPFLSHLHAYSKILKAVALLAKIASGADKKILRVIHQSYDCPTASENPFSFPHRKQEPCGLSECFHRADVFEKQGMVTVPETEYATTKCVVLDASMALKMPVFD